MSEVRELTDEERRNEVVRLTENNEELREENLNLRKDIVIYNDLLEASDKKIDALLNALVRVNQLSS